VEERAWRRFNELRQRNEPAHYENILRALKRRDRIDSTREVAPLRPAEDAVMINSDGLDATQVLEKVKGLIPQCRAEC
jgi:cytidylate kinase